MTMRICLLLFGSWSLLLAVATATTTADYANNTNSNNKPSIVRRNRRPITTLPKKNGGIIGRRALQEIFQISSSSSSSSSTQEAAPKTTMAAAASSTASMEESAFNDNDHSFLLDTTATRRLVLTSSSSSSSSSSCPSACDSELCTCIDRHGEPAYCAPQIQKVCTIQAVPNCVPPQFVNYFETFFCPYADCVMSGKSVAECSCNFYSRYCEMYEDHDDDVGYCEVASCCEGQVHDAGRNVCMMDGEVDSQEMVMVSQNTAAATTTTGSATAAGSPITGSPATSLPTVNSTDEPSVGPTLSKPSSLSPTPSPTVEDPMSMTTNVMELMSMPTVESEIELSMSLNGADRELSMPINEAGIELSMAMITGMDAPSNPSASTTMMNQLASNDDPKGYDWTEDAVPEAESTPSSSLVELSDLSMSMIIGVEFSSMSMATTIADTTASNTIQSPPTSNQEEDEPLLELIGQSSMPIVEAEFGSMSMASVIDTVSLSPNESRSTPAPTAYSSILEEEEPLLELSGLSMAMFEEMSNSMSMATTIDTGLNPGTSISSPTSRTAKPTARRNSKPTTSPSSSAVSLELNDYSLSMAMFEELSSSMSMLGASSDIGSRSSSSPAKSPTTTIPKQPTTTIATPSSSPEEEEEHSFYWSDLESSSLSMAIEEFSSMSMSMSMSMSVNNLEITTPRPSKAPSQKPTTNAPSGSPTTQNPTTAPSGSPVTRNPTTAPSGSPSLKPTLPPSSEPTSAPSLTSLPSPSPTYSPSRLTPWPSYSPTPPPSKSPASASLDQNKLTKAPKQPPTTENPTASPVASVMLTATPMHSIHSTDSVMPTISPSLSSFPTSPTVVKVETDSQLGLVNMSSVMDPEAIRVFEGSCETFLEDRWVYTTPPIYGVECEVTGQRLLFAEERRVLVDDSSAGGVSSGGGGEQSIIEKQELQAVAEEPSLLVNINIKGNADQTSSLGESSDIPFDNLVYGTFSEHSSVFEDRLKADGREVGIEDFEDLMTVHSVRPVDVDTRPSKSPASAPLNQNKLTKAPKQPPTTENPTALPPTPVMPTVTPTHLIHSTDSTTPTISPSLSPFPTPPTVIKLETDSQLGLVNMSSVMDPEAIRVFEGSCETFLGDLWVYATPPIYGVECEVTGQQLQLIERRRVLVDDSSDGGVSSGGALRGGEPQISTQKQELQALTGEPSLLVDINIKGNADQTGYVRESSDVGFGNLVYGTFSVQSSLFVNQLKADGSEVGIEDFEDLTTVYAVRPVNQDRGEGDNNGDNTDIPDEISKNPGGGGDNSVDEDSILKDKGIIAAIALSSVAVLGLFAALFYHLGNKRSSDSYESYDMADGSDDTSEAEVIDVYNDSLNVISQKQNNERQQPPPFAEVQSFPNAGAGGDVPDNIGTGGTNNGGSGESQLENLTYMYSLEDALASPHSNLTPLSAENLVSPAMSNMSLTDQMQHQMTQWIDGEPISARNRISMDIVAPPGKLGIIIDTCSEGPIVHSVKPTSPLDGLIFKGDLIVSVDDENTREWSAHYLTKLVAKKSRFERKITVLRSDGSTKPPVILS